MFGNGANKGAAPVSLDPTYSAVHERIVELYQTSALQQQAVYQIITDVTRSPNIEANPNDFDATHFVPKLIETLLVHGSCLWRPGKNVVQPPEIYDPMGFYIEQQRSKFAPKKIPGLNRGASRVGNKWHMAMLETPLTEFDSTYAASAPYAQPSICRVPLQWAVGLRGGLVLTAKRASQHAEMDHQGAKKLRIQSREIGTCDRGAAAASSPAQSAQQPAHGVFARLCSGHHTGRQFVGGHVLKVCGFAHSVRRSSIWRGRSTNKTK